MKTSYNVRSACTDFSCTETVYGIVEEKIQNRTPCPYNVRIGLILNFFSFFFRFTVLIARKKIRVRTPIFVKAGTPLLEDGFRRTLDQHSSSLLLFEN